MEGSKKGKYIRSKETKIKNGLANKGRKLSPEHKEKFRLGRIAYVMPKWSEERKRQFSGTGNHFFGKTHTIESIDKIIKAHLGKPSKKWKGGYENKLFLNNQRRVKKIGNGGFHSLIEWSLLKELHNWTCLCCKEREPFITITRDHIIPISKGGTDNIENIQPLCRSCNSKKYNKTISYV